MTECGRLGAFITKVKKGSVADVMGHLKPGDEVIMWNDECLQDACYEDVYEIILASKNDKSVSSVVNVCLLVLTSFFYSSSLHSNCNFTTNV